MSTRSLPRLVRTALATVVTCLGVAATASAIEPGQKAPDFSLPLLAGGGTLALAEYRGKVVYVDFWASWCGPCLNAVPALEKIRGEFPGEDFQILAVNLDKKAKKARKFVAKQGIGYPSVADPEGRLPRQFGLETMPTSYLLDRQGVVRYVHEGFRDGDSEEIRKEIRRWIAK